MLLRRAAPRQRFCSALVHDIPLLQRAVAVKNDVPGAKSAEREITRRQMLAGVHKVLEGVAAATARASAAARLGTKLLLCRRRWGRPVVRAYLAHTRVPRLGLRALLRERAVAALSLAARHGGVSGCLGDNFLVTAPRDALFMIVLVLALTEDPSS